MGQPGADGMTLLQRLKSVWREDSLLRSVVRNSSYLFSSNTISMVLTTLQGLMAAALLGAKAYGTQGLVIAFASNVNRLLSFRMNELVVKYGGHYLADGEREKAGAVVKIAGIAEAVTSISAYGLLLLLAPWGARVFIKDPSTVPWIGIFGLALVANLATETSTAVLQLGGHYRTQAAFTLLQNIVTAGWIGAAFFLKGDVIDVIMAYLAGKSLFGLGMLGAALYHAKKLLGEGWWKAAAHRQLEARGMISFALSTNLSQTVNMVIRDSEVLWVGYFLSSTAAGYYKFALAMVNVILLPINPFIQTTFPEITRSVAKRTWKQLRNLLRRTSLLALAWTGSAVVGLLLLGKWLLSIFKHGEYLPALPVIWILLIGFGFANVFFWNRSLLLAFGRPHYPLAASTFAGLIKIGLMFLLVPLFGIRMQAAAFSLYFVLSIGAITLEGLRGLKKAENQSVPGGAAA